MSARISNRSLVMGSLRERSTITLVAGLSGFYAAALMMGASILQTLSSGDGSSVGVYLSIVAGVFIGIALYVAAIVITGCVATVIAGRLRQIATLRLLGADSRTLRRDVCRSCGIAGLVGGAIGIVVGTLTSDIARIWLVHRGTLPARAYASVDVRSMFALVAVVACAALAGYVGSRKVLEVNPAQAMTGVLDAHGTKRAGRVRAAFTVLLLVPGVALLALAMKLGEQGSQAGFFVAFLGSALAGSAVLIGASFIVPRLVALVGHLLGNDPAARVARRNATADAMRTTRATVGLVVGVTLVTTFASGMKALQDSVAGWDLSPADERRAQQVLSTSSTVLICIVVISSIIAAVGFVSTMSLLVIQRRREIGLVRALGFTTRQVATMVTKEAVALGATAVLFGLLLGVTFGSVGAQSLVGSVNDGFVWGLPAPVLAAIVLCAVALVLVAALPPARRALRITPVQALRVEA